jgi:putative transposase
MNCSSRLASFVFRMSGLKKTSSLSTRDRRALVDVSDPVVPVLEQCKWLGISRSGFYYRSRRISLFDLSAMQALDWLYLEDPTRGTRRICNELRKLGIRAGRDYTRTLMQRMRIKAVYCRPRITCMDPALYKYPCLLRNVKIERFNQVLAIDIWYLPMERGYLYLVAVMDVNSRCILGLSLSNSMDTDWVVRTLRSTVLKYGAPEIINSGQGNQFTSDAYVAYVKSLGSTKISMDGKGRAIDNVFIERFWRTLKHERIYLFCPRDGHEADCICAEFIEYYNTKRDHSSLGNIPLLKYYRQAA